MELAISSRVDKGFSKGPNIAPRVRPRSKVVEEPKKKLKVDEELPIQQEIQQEIQEPQLPEPIKPVGNIIRVPEMISQEITSVSKVADCPIIMKDLIKSKFEQGTLSKFEISRRKMLAEKKKSGLKEESVKEIEEPKSQENEELQAPRGPQLRLVNGDLIIDENSLTVVAETEKMDFQRIEEGAARFVSSASFRLRPKTARVKWTEEMNDLFYDGLSYFGTDFGLTALLFPGFTRNQIKLKFNHEERINSSKVNIALMNRKAPSDELKLQMKSNLNQNLEKSAQMTQNEDNSRSATSRKGRAKASEKEEQENQAPETEPAKEQEIAPIEEKILQETAQKSFEAAIDTIRPMSSNTLKPGQGPKIGPKVPNRVRKQAPKDAS